MRQQEPLKTPLGLANVLRIARPLNADPEQALVVRVFDLRGAEGRGLRFADGQFKVSTPRAGSYLLSMTDGSGTRHQRFVNAERTAAQALPASCFA